MLLKNSFQKIHDFTKLFGIAISLLIFAFAAFGQVDSTFNPVPSIPTTSSNNPFYGSSTVQPDGKILIYDNFQNVQGLPRNRIARLNSDSSLDVSFNCTACDFRIGSAAIQPDGKIVVGGSFGESIISSRLRRLNSDGSIDTSFTSPFSEQPDASTVSNHVWGIQPDGKMFVSQHFSFVNFTWSYLYRLNPNGSIDTTFERMYFNGGTIQSGPHYFLSDVKLLPDGKILVGGYHEFGQLFRVNTNGTKDTTFQSPILVPTGSNTYSYIRSFDIQADGKIVLFGNFTSITGVPKNNIARLNADQSVDTSFTFPLTFGTGYQAIEKVQLMSDGKLLISGTFSNSKKIVRLGSDGSLDNSFNTPTNLASVADWTLDSGNRILVTGTITGEGAKPIRLNTDGSRDTTFNVTFGTTTTTTPVNIDSTTVQADGKILITGDFTHINGVPRRNFARLNADGNLDTTFNPGTGFDDGVEQLVFQSDGKILAVGSFGRYNGTARTRIARINANGSLDTTFNATLNNYVAAAAIQADGKILICGSFTTVNGSARTGIARLNADGSLDNSFDPLLVGPYQIVYVNSILAQADGKIMFGGDFWTIYGYSRQGLARLNPDGSIDFSFDAGVVYGINNIIQQPDGKYLTSNYLGVFRKNIDGSPDTSFQSVSLASSSSIYAMLLQADGSILIGGNFTQVRNVQRQRIAKLNPNGSLNLSFLPEGADATVFSLSKQTDNNIIVGGAFLNIGNLPRSGIARLNYTPLIRNTLYDYDGDGKADVSVFRPSENKWFIYRSSDGQVLQQIFAVSDDIPVPADYDGDGKTDMAIYRPASADWWSLSTINGNQINVQWGEPNVLARPSDFDGDGKADYIFFLPSNSTWYGYGSTVGASYVTFGIVGDKPVTGDFDGDGKSDPAIFRPSTGDWWYLSSINNAQLAVRWGIASDIPAPADYDGDGKTDFAVYRPSTGVWYIINSSNGSFTIMTFGLAEDKPVPADYDGDGKADIAVFRPSTGIWYQMRSTAGFAAQQFGISTDIPTENVFIP